MHALCSQTLLSISKQLPSSTPNNRTRLRTPSPILLVTRTPLCSGLRMPQHRKNNISNHRITTCILPGIHTGATEAEYEDGKRRQGKQPSIRDNVESKYERFLAREPTNQYETSVLALCWRGASSDWKSVTVKVPRWADCRNGGACVLP